MLIFIFVIAALCFVFYAVYTRYNATPSDQAVYKRVMLSVSAAVASIVAAIATAAQKFLSSGVSP